MDNDTQLAVFENGNESEAEHDRSRALLIVGAIAVVVLAALIALLLMTKPGSEREVENMVRAGSPEFDAYKDKVELEITDKVVHPNMIGMWQLEARARLTNRGDRPLKAVEVHGKMLDLEDKVIAQADSRPIPRIRQAPLNPGESMNISVKVDAPAKVSEGEVKDIVIELRGLRFQ
ncbi:MAG: hypothetical protein JMDDDDMK_01531 [Acidobacteria bacterium]|nr:hypothetical protein [Acidobacteriota bacterium]